MYPLSPKICDIKSFAMGGGGETFYSRSQLEFRRTFSKQVENQDDCRAFRSGLPSPFPLQARIKIKSSAILPEDPSSLRSFFTLHGFPRSHLYLRGGGGDDQLWSGDGGLLPLWSPKLNQPRSAALFPLHPLSLRRRARNFLRGQRLRLVVEAPGSAAGQALGGPPSLWRRLPRSATL